MKFWICSALFILVTTYVVWCAMKTYLAPQVNQYAAQVYAAAPHGHADAVDKDGHGYSVELEPLAVLQRDCIVSLGEIGYFLIPLTISFALVEAARRGRKNT